ncbi:hypothetical protein EVAR_84337_1 [Eumeta japonica]|uniref:Uncharacterized protein n=1 Tax=Eumeta variegata TaxID=151549 RepID=A0A4C1U5G6_EUMVA|nr:hypothetical protein EVAR_84337_1 [Eumeta japonica]
MLVLDEGEAQLKLDTQPIAGGRTLVDADRIKAARIGDPRRATHASDGSSQGSMCQRAASFNLFFFDLLLSSIFDLLSSIFNPVPTLGHPRARASLRKRSAAGGGGTGLRSGG